MKKALAMLLVLVSAALAVYAGGSEEDLSKWPSKPIHIINQSAAGSGPDLFIRQMQPVLQKELGTSLVLESKEGSGGKLACDYVWNSNPDGYTILAHSSPLTTVTQISKDCEYSIKDMKHIASIDATPYAVIVRADSPIKSVADLIEYCKTNNASNANSGIGGAMFLQSRIMADALGIDYTEVPYNGGQPCTLAVMNGDVTFTVTSFDVVMNNNQVRALCILADERVAAIPDVPTIVEEGYTFPFLTMRRGLLAPAETPDEIVQKLVDAFEVALNDPSFTDYAAANGINLDLIFGEEYQALDAQIYDEIMQFVDYL